MGLKHRLDAIEKKVIPKETVKIKVTLCESMPPREEMQMRWESFVNPPKIETIH